MTTTDPTDTVTQGLDVDRFHEFAEHATANPDEIQMELGARALYR